MLTDLAWLLGVLTLALLSPGPDFFLVVKNSLGTTRARAFGTVAGIAVGLAAQTIVISLGFAAAPPVVLRSVQLGGAVFLAWIGVRALFSRAPAESDRARERAADMRGAHGGFIEGLLCNLTNPKAFVFFVSLFAQVLQPGTAPAMRVVLPVVVVSHGAVAWSLVVLAVQSPLVARRLTRAQRWLPRVFGAALVVLAVVVAYEALR